MTKEAIAVGLGEFKISRDPTDVLVAYGLGSCVGVGLYDPVARLAGMLHAVLPRHLNGADNHSAKYADSGVEALLAALAALGARPTRLTIRVVGGADMLKAAEFGNALRVGERNLDAARAALTARHLAPNSEAVGGKVGRTFRLYVADGRMTVREMGKTEREF